MSIPQTGTIVAGIGDDVIYGLGTIFMTLSVILGTLFYWTQRQPRSQVIHPQSAEDIQGTREHLQLGEPDTQSHVGQRPRRHRDGEELTCPVCLMEVEFGIETNCSHIFCGRCFVTYWRHGNWGAGVRCPVCRQQVTVLMLNFTDEDQRTNSERRTELLQEIGAFNRRYSGEPVPWRDYIRDLPTILRHVISDFFSVGGLLWVYHLRIIFLLFVVVVYFISPLDVIPEAAFGLLGLLDDFLILLLFAIYVSIIYRAYMANRDYI